MQRMDWSSRSEKTRRKSKVITLKTHAAEVIVVIIPPVTFTAVSVACEPSWPKIIGELIHIRVDSSYSYAKLLTSL